MLTKSVSQEDLSKARRQIRYAANNLWRDDKPITRFQCYARRVLLSLANVIEFGDSYKPQLIAVLREFADEMELGIEEGNSPR